jgi:hypothetical protein
MKSLVLISLLSFTFFCSALDFYVSTTGDDSNRGNKTSPFRTIQKGLSVLDSNDVLNILSGNYFLDSALNIRNKTNIQIVGDGATLEKNELEKLLSNYRSLEIESCSFIKVSGITFKQSIFVGSSKDSLLFSGGALFISNSRNILISNIVVEDSISGYGGALSMINCQNVSVNSSIFRNNKAIFINENDILIKESRTSKFQISDSFSTLNFPFEKSSINQDSGKGGAVSIYHSSEINFSKCLIFGNSAQKGGAIYSLNSTVSVIQSKVQKNSCREQGSAFFLDKGLFKIVSTNFWENACLRRDGRCKHMFDTTIFYLFEEFGVQVFVKTLLGLLVLLFIPMFTEIILIFIQEIFKKRIQKDIELVKTIKSEIKELEKRRKNLQLEVVSNVELNQHGDAIDVINSDKVVEIPVNNEMVAELPNDESPVENTEQPPNESVEPPNESEQPPNESVENIESNPMNKSVQDLKEFENIIPYSYRWSLRAYGIWYPASHFYLWRIFHRSFIIFTFTLISLYGGLVSFKLKGLGDAVDYSRLFLEISLNILFNLSPAVFYVGSLFTFHYSCEHITNFFKRTSGKRLSIGKIKIPYHFLINATISILLFGPYLLFMICFYIYGSVPFFLPSFDSGFESFSIFAFGTYLSIICSLTSCLIFTITILCLNMMWDIDEFFSDVIEQMNDGNFKLFSILNGHLTLKNHLSKQNKALLPLIGCFCVMVPIILVLTSMQFLFGPYDATLGLFSQYYRYSFTVVYAMVTLTIFVQLGFVTDRSMKWYFLMDMRLASEKIESVDLKEMILFLSLLKDHHFAFKIFFISFYTRTVVILFTCVSSLMSLLNAFSSAYEGFFYYYE